MSLPTLFEVELGWDIVYVNIDGLTPPSPHSESLFQLSLFYSEMQLMQQYVAANFVKQREENSCENLIVYHAGVLEEKEVC